MVCKFYSGSAVQEKWIKTLEKNETYVMTTTTTNGGRSASSQGWRGTRVMGVFIAFAFFSGHYFYQLQHLTRTPEALNDLLHMFAWLFIHICVGTV